ncbi:protein activator [Williamsia sp. Leaf354]|uniref:Protein activator n=1 Tax=Williamsia herbipolensis TaxID=1603258 RepID=A0AAU4K271_9NOCA|nr:MULTISPECIES: alkane oxidation protein activator PraA [Williamsia]KQR97386.1 protein activator [Williamsia sp. Leaf354]MCX6470514.1 protein activator [Mycobacteriales bacterium]
MRFNTTVRSRALATVAATVAVVGATIGAGVAGAATISPANTAFTAPGTISVTSDASFGVPVNCNITLTGSVNADGSAASITGAKVSGSNFLCGVPVIKGLPWTLTPTSATTGQVSGVAFSVLSSNCGPATLAGSFDNLTNTLTSTNQSLPGNCTINNLTVKPNPAFTLS